MKLNIVSFGFRHGKPNFDKVYDCRTIANPHRNSRLKELNGMNEDVATFVFDDPEAWKLHDRAVIAIYEMVEDFTPQMYVGFGCVGGKHRSVALAQQVAKTVRLKGVDTTIFHRELREFR